MRMRPYHVELKKLYDNVGRKDFATYMFLNLFGHRSSSATGFDSYDIEAKQKLIQMIRRNIVIPADGSIYKINPNRFIVAFHNFDIKKRWIISGKGIYELAEVFDGLDIEVKDEDYMFVAKMELYSGD